MPKSTRKEAKRLRHMKKNEGDVLQLTNLNNKTNWRKITDENYRAVYNQMIAKIAEIQSKQAAAKALADAQNDAPPSQDNGDVLNDVQEIKCETSDDDEDDYEDEVSSGESSYDESLATQDGSLHLHQNDEFSSSLSVDTSYTQVMREFCHLVHNHAYPLFDKEADMQSEEFIELQKKWKDIENMGMKFFGEMGSKHTEQNNNTNVTTGM